MFRNRVKAIWMGPWDCFFHIQHSVRAGAFFHILAFMLDSVKRKLCGHVSLRRRRILSDGPLAAEEGRKYHFQFNTMFKV
jgi:hypothetical protein